MGASLTLSALQVLNVDTNQPVSLGTLNYNSTLRRATVTFAQSILTDGNYRLTIAAGALPNLATAYQFDFYTLAGDANRDRVVDVTDLGILATNWQGTGKNFAQADFNYDGIVDVSDLGILATNWQKTLAAPALKASPVTKPGKRLPAGGALPLSMGVPVSKPMSSVFGIKRVATDIDLIVV